MINTVVGFLTVVSESEERDKRRNKLWNCKCSCGNMLLVPTKSLRSGDKKSCGCKSKAETSGTHGLYGTPTHNSWRTMIERCTKEYHKSYERYKNIPIDPKWMTFEGFYSDMGERPYCTTLDRIRGELGYCKTNCRWATLSIQQQNKKPSQLNCNGFPGIFESRGSYVARIRHDGKRLYLGCFATPESAHQAYDTKGRELFGSEWKSYFEEGQQKR